MRPCITLSKDKPMQKQSQITKAKTSSGPVVILGLSYLIAERISSWVKLFIDK